MTFLCLQGCSAWPVDTAAVVLERWIGLHPHWLWAFMYLHVLEVYCGQGFMWQFLFNSLDGVSQSNHILSMDQRKWHAMEIQVELPVSFQEWPWHWTKAIVTNESFLKLLFKRDSNRFRLETDISNWIQSNWEVIITVHLWRGKAVEKIRLSQED